MTIAEYTKDAEELAKDYDKPGEFMEGLMNTVDVWSDDAAKGYAALALKRCGYRPESIDRVLKAMEIAMEDVTITDAEASYYKS